MKRTSQLLALALAWLLPLAWTPDARADPTWGRPQPALSSTTIGTTPPLSGGGDLSANRTLSCPTCVVGPASATDNEIARYDSTTGKLIQTSGLSIEDTASNQTPVKALTAATGLLLQGNVTTGTTPGVELRNQNSYTASSGTQTGLYLAPTINQTGTAGFNSIWANPTLSACGSGGCNLLSLQAGSVNKLRVSGTGDLIQSSAATLGHVLYNTADETTNFESFRLYWTGNVATIDTQQGGSGSLRTLLVRGGPGGGSTSYSPFGSIVYGSTGATVTSSHTFTHSTFTSTSLVQDAMVVGSTVNQASGTGGYNGIRVNPTLTAVGSTGAKLLRLQTASTDRFWVDSAGAIDMDSTITAAGTTGNQTINKPSGTVNIAASGTAVTITNSLVTANTIMAVVARTNDATCAVKNYVPGAGTVTINMTAACTAETSVGFAILDKN